MMLQLIEAQEKHSPLLQKFFREQVVSAHLDYSIDRTHSFFDQYRLLSPDHSTLMLMDGEQRLLGAASVTFVRAYVNHQEQTIAYLSDLRISLQRHAVQSWADQFIPALYKRLDEKNCKYVFSIIEQYENQAYNALLRPQKLKRNLPHYYLFRKMNLNFYFGKWLFSKPPRISVSIEHGQEKDIEEICDYLLQKKIGGKLYIHVTPELLQQRIKNWPNFSVHNFLIARNSQGKIVGCMAPWNNRDVQQIVARGYQGESLLLHQTLKLFSPLRVTRALPDVDRPANLKFITHCSVDNGEVFYALMDRAYKESAKGEILAHTNYFGDYFTRPPKAFVSSKIPYGFYSVLRPDEELPQFLKPNPFSAPPDFSLLHL